MYLKTVNNLFKSFLLLILLASCYQSLLKSYFCRLFTPVQKAILALKSAQILRLICFRSFFYSQPFLFNPLNSL